MMRHDLPRGCPSDRPEVSPCPEVEISMSYEGEGEDSAPRSSGRDLDDPDVIGDRRAPRRARLVDGQSLRALPLGHAVGSGGAKPHFHRTFSESFYVLWPNRVGGLVLDEEIGRIADLARSATLQRTSRTTP
jgi:hypothetical protein